MVGVFVSLCVVHLLVGAYKDEYCPERMDFYTLIDRLYFVSKRFNCFGW
jgi:hypothetical protein